MKCIKCNSDKFELKQIELSPEIKEGVVTVAVEAYVCEECGTPLMTDKQMNAFRKAGADKYREKHNLLTSKQIIEYREALGMSQTNFAHYLQVGEASIKRWETYYIQDSSQDDHIRLKCDEAYAELNYLDILWKHKQPDVFSGGKRFSFELFKNVSLFLAKKTEESIIIINKIHYYVDFLHYKINKISLTGARYVPLKYGPCPDQYRILYDVLVQKGMLEIINEHHYKAKIDPDISIFSENEIRTLEFILDIFKRKGGKYFYNLSHKEKGYTDTEECKFISYEYANHLNI